MEATSVYAGQSIDEAFQTILKADYNFTQKWLPIAYNREDIEGLHQARIGLRRMRSALSIFRRVIPRSVLMEMGLEMKWLAHSFTMARDVDVFLTETLDDEHITGKIGPSSGEEKLRELAKKRSDIGYQKVRETIDSDRYKKFHETFQDWVENKRWRESMEPEAQERLDRPIRPFVAKMMTRRFNRILHVGLELNRMNDEELHQVRIRIKKIRYSSEFFAGLFDKNDMEKFRSTAKKLQSHFGVINDIAVLHNLVDILMKGVEEDDAKIFIDRVLNLREGQKIQAKRDLSAYWYLFTAAKLPWVAPVPVGDEWD
ncbi:CHAD domain-containing protein [Magnetococcales bacterium HHB-1]